MQCFWVRFERLPYPTGLNLGAGVTARSEVDALKMIAAAFEKAPVASLSLIESIADLDQGHVAPNTGNIFFERGIWFPRGYETIARETL